MASPQDTIQPGRNMYFSGLRNKFEEALKAVLPIIGIVLLLSLTVAPIPSGIMLAFLFGGLFLIVGMMFFSLGAELAMETMGGKLGAKITKTRKLPLILFLGFLLGFMITISEPDLQVLANQVASIPNLALIISVAVGVGLFLVAAFLRMVLNVPLRLMLLVSYAIVITLSFFAPKDFIAVAFDSGGVTTGPMTVPFIMAFGIGISSIRSDRRAADDSFGLVALCSVGPIIAVLLLAMIFHPDSATYTETWLPDFSETVEMGSLFVQAFPTYLKEMAIALLPISVFFGVFQLVSLRLDRHTLIRIGVGVLYTYVGLVLFLTGGNGGFLPAGTFLGQTLGGLSYRWIVIPIGMLIGFFIVKAEPAIYVLMRQVEELTNGAIKGKVLQRSLCISVAVSIGLAMLRVLTGVSVFWFVIPGYAAALALSFFTPKMFTAIAFDSGGVASGPMTATFLLPFAMGACMAVGGNVTTDAFGVVAMVAMTPLITIQLLGLLYKVREKRSRELYVPGGAGEEDIYAIIEL